MAKDRPTDKPTAEKATKTTPVTFHDAGYKQRTLALTVNGGTRTLAVINSKVTVDEPALIEALDNLYGLQRT
ncbi:MAG: hypothetical protein RRB22_01120 [Gammaproteobacteria bacterium]|nr:hypothetical protein [Gammaproteobacteria bacterium]